MSRSTYHKQRHCFPQRGSRIFDFIREAGSKTQPVLPSGVILKSHVYSRGRFQVSTNCVVIRYIEEHHINISREGGTKYQPKFCFNVDLKNKRNHIICEGGSPYHPHLLDFMRYLADKRSNFM